MKIEIDGCTVVFDEDHEGLIGSKSWRVYKRGAKLYVARSTRVDGKHKTIFFHRLIVGARTGEFVDHINGNSLDNRSSNLRLATIAQNNRNAESRNGSRSKYRGVDLNNGRWRARIRVNYQHLLLGGYESEIEAAFAYDIASLKYHGEYGRRNFLPLA